MKPGRLNLLLLWIIAGLTACQPAVATVLPSSIAPTSTVMASTPTEIPASPTPMPTETAVPSTATVPPLVSSIITGLLNQACTAGNVTNFNTCTESHCCETNSACNDDPDCTTAAQCFMNNGGMRGYGGISNCYQLPGAEKYMQNFACRFQYCGQYMTLNEGELCLTEKCAEATAACFSNPDCFALKFCIVDHAGTPAECRQRHPEGIADFERWSSCGNETGCYALMP